MIVRAHLCLAAGPALAVVLAGCSTLPDGEHAGGANITRENPPSLVDPTRMGYSHVVSVRNGTLVFIAGQGPTDAAGKAVGRGDLRAQARQAVDNVLSALAAIDAGPQNIVYLRINVVGYQPRMLMELAPELRRLQGDNDKPAASIFVGVESLIVPGTLIEIETVAAI